MVHDVKPSLPDIFPVGEIRVEDEEHTYLTYDGDPFAGVIEETEYTLDKAPVDEIIEVTGTFNGQDKTFVKGTDYQLSDITRTEEETFTFENIQDQYLLDNVPEANSVSITDNSGDTYTEGTDFKITSTERFDDRTIEWLDSGGSPDDDEEFTATYTVNASSILKWDDGEDTPDAGTIFEVTYICESLISRYLTSSEEEFASVHDDFDQAIAGKFVAQATGQQLDELGKIFGVLGKRTGRDDVEYRDYLTSITESFTSTGTKDGIIRAVSAATDVPREDISINEDFQNTEYEIVIVPQTEVIGSVVEQVADISDPSGVEQSATVYDFPNETFFADDSTNIIESILGGADSMASDDASATDANKILAAQESTSADDQVVTANAKSNVFWGNDWTASDADDSLLWSE